MHSSLSTSLVSYLYLNPPRSLGLSSRIWSHQAVGLESRIVTFIAHATCSTCLYDVHGYWTINDGTLKKRNLDWFALWSHYLICFLCFWDMSNQFWSHQILTLALQACPFPKDTNGLWIFAIYVYLLSEVCCFISVCAFKNTTVLEDVKLIHLWALAYMLRVRHT